MYYFSATKAFGMEYTEIETKTKEIDRNNASLIQASIGGALIRI